MSKELIQLADKDVKEVFYSENGLQVFVDSIAKIIDQHEYDLETTKGKDAIKSLSASVSRSKTYLDGKGKDLVAGVKAKLKIVDQNRKSMRDQLDVLRDKARQPLTDYEEEQKAIAVKIQKTKADIERLGMPCDIAGNRLPLQNLEDNLEKLDNIDYSHVPESLEPEKIVENSKVNLKAAIKEEKERIEKELELERLKKAEEERLTKEAEEKAIQEQKERDERIAKEAAEKAEKEKLEAEKRAKQLEKEKLEAEERAKQAEIEAKERAERAAEEARKAELKRQEEEKIAAEEEQRRLEANKKHIGAIRKEIKEGLMEACSLDEKTAKSVVLALVKMERVTINY